MSGLAVVLLLVSVGRVCRACLSEDGSCPPVEVHCKGNCSHCTPELCGPLVNGTPDTGFTCPEGVDEECPGEMDNPLCARGGSSSCRLYRPEMGDQFNLTYKFSHINKMYAAFELEWSRVSHTGNESYTIILSNNDLEDCNPATAVICIAGLSQNVTRFRHRVRYSTGDSTFSTINVMLLPNGWCEGPRLSLPTPWDWYRVCPGKCYKDHNISRASNKPPRDIESSVTCLNESAVTVNLSWQPGERFYGHYPDELLLHFMRVFNESKLIAGPFVLQGQRNVSLQVLGVNPSRSYRIQLAEFICKERVASSIYVSLSIPTCPPTPSTYPSLSFSSSISLSLPSPSFSSESITPSMPALPPSPLFYLTPVVVILSIFLLVLTTILIISRIRTRSKSQVEESQARPLKPSCVKRVLVLYSQSVSRYDRECILENVVKALMEYNVECVYFEGSCVKGSIADWMAAHVRSCNNVLLVCNKQFAVEWSQARGSSLYGHSLVYILRQLVDSYVKHDKKMLEKFAILYLRRKDQNCLDNPYLRNMKSFLVNPSDVEQFEHIVRFICEKAMYKLA